VLSISLTLFFLFPMGFNTLVDLFSDDMLWLAFYGLSYVMDVSDDGIEELRLMSTY